jgi:NLP/P60 protein
MAEMNSEKKDISQIKVGDLLFFITSGGDTINHVGIYVGNNEFIHASSAKNKVVVSKLDSDFYTKAFKWGLSPYNR